MKYLPSQNGFIPLPIILALALAALIGAWIGSSVGSGHWWWAGVGFAAVLISADIVLPYIKKWKNAWNKDED